MAAPGPSDAPIAALPAFPGGSRPTQNQLAAEAFPSPPQATPPGFSQNVARASVPTVVREITLYSIRNGNAADIEPILSRPSVPAWAHWVVMPGMTAENALQGLDAMIRTHAYHIAKNAPADWDAPKRRKAAIMLGTLRTSMVAAYNLRLSDMAPGECVMGPIHMHTPAEGPHAGHLCYATRLQNLANVPAEGADPHEVERAARVHLTEALELTAVEATAVTALIRAGQAVLPLQGYALLIEDHHFIDNPSKQSFKAFKTMEDQLIEGQDLKPWFSADYHFSRDVCWHKAGHPVKVLIKKVVATDMRVKENLNAAGLGSAAVRLPGMEAEARAASAYISLARTVNTTWREYNGGLDCSRLENLMSLLGRCGYGFRFPEAGVALAGTTQVFHSRKEILTELRQTIDRAGPVMAVASGFNEHYMTLQDQRVQARNTIGQAFSVRKLQEAHGGHYNQGWEAYGDFRAHKARIRKEGAFVAPQLRVE